MSVSSPVPRVYNFSSGYYVVDGFQVKESDIDVARVKDHMYAYIQDNYYGAQTTPIIFRHNESNSHFEIIPSEDVRINSIEMPGKFVEEMGLHSETEQFLIAKPQHARNISQFSRTVLE